MGALIWTAMFERAMSSASQTVFIANRPWATTATARCFFEPAATFKSLLEDLGLQRLLAEQPLQFADLALQRTVLRRGHHGLFGLRRRQSAL